MGSLEDTYKRVAECVATLVEDDRAKRSLCNDIRAFKESPDLKKTAEHICPDCKYRLYQKAGGSCRKLKYTAMDYGG